MAPDAPRIHDRIAQIYRSGVVHGVDDAPHSIMPASVTPERGRFLADLCRAENARATLEIGMAWGLSTLFILEALAENGALPRAHVVADPFQSSRWHGAALRSVREAGAAELVEFHEEPSEILLPRMASERRLFDFAFIDGNHRFDAVFVDMVFVSRLLKPGGLMVLDDAWFDPVYLACRFAETNLSYAPVAEFVAGKARKSWDRSSADARLSQAAPGGSPRRLPLRTVFRRCRRSWAKGARAATPQRRNDRAYQWRPRRRTPRVRRRLAA
jgi:predicted O-methyltransferase YrrM